MAAIDAADNDLLHALRAKAIVPVWPMLDARGQTCTAVDAFLAPRSDWSFVLVHITRLLGALGRPDHCGAAPVDDLPDTALLH